MLKVQELALELIPLLRPVVTRIRKHDRSLANQLCRAATSIALNIAEGNYSDPGTARARFNNAAGSASETQTALRVALAWGYLQQEQVESESALAGSHSGDALEACSQGTVAKFVYRIGFRSVEFAGFPNLSIFEGAFFEGPAFRAGVDADVQIYGAWLEHATISVAGMLQARLVSGTAVHVATAIPGERATRREVEFLLQPRTARVGVVVAAIREVGDLRARVGIGLFVVIAGGAAAARRRKSTEQGENSPANGRRAAHQLVTARENFRIGNRRSRCRLGIRAGVRIRDCERG